MFDYKTNYIYDIFGYNVNRGVEDLIYTKLIFYIDRIYNILCKTLPNNEGFSIYFDDLFGKPFHD